MRCLQRLIPCFIVTLLVGCSQSQDQAGHPEATLDAASEAPMPMEMEPEPQMAQSQAKILPSEQSDRLKNELANLSNTTQNQAVNQYRVPEASGKKEKKQRDNMGAPEDSSRITIEMADNAKGLRLRADGFVGGVIEPSEEVIAELIEQDASMPSPKPASPMPTAGEAASGQFPGQRDAGDDKDRRLSSFFDSRDRIDGLQFKSAQGYWKNTYIPGDPHFRYLQHRLDRQRHLIPFATPETLLAQYWQPFDPPTNSALNVYVHADKTAVAGPTRLMLQVGLKGTEQLSGRRPAMNIAMVVYLPETPSMRHQKLLQELLFKFSQERRIDDRFTLILAGQAGETLITPEQFNYGPLSVILQQVFTGNDPYLQAKPALSLIQALRKAKGKVEARDDPTSPLGASAVVLVSPFNITHGLAPLKELAHQSSVNGITMSVIGINLPASSQLNEIALYGQGRFRMLSAIDQVESLVRTELSIISRVVARAIRINIRLAANVKLIDMLGSEPLEEERSEQIRAMELSIDRRMAANLGIAADRGQDDPGIQIVIPSYYAGDDHVILLDVLAEQPGRLAEVSVKYKDLVFLRNGHNQSSFALGSIAKSRGPLEFNVLKNVLAFQQTQHFQQAASFLDQGNIEGAKTVFSAQIQQIDHLQSALANLSHDQELKRDTAIFAQYANALSQVSLPEQMQYLIDSLEYARYRRVLPAHLSQTDASEGIRP